MALISPSFAFFISLRTITSENFLFVFLLTAFESQAQDNSVGKVLLHTQDSASYSITGWHYESGVTFCKIQMGSVWAVFQLPGDHVPDVRTMTEQGCVLSKRWGLFYFSDVPEARYCKPGDEEKLKIALGLDKICKE